MHEETQTQFTHLLLQYPQTFCKEGDCQMLLIEIFKH